ncbi:MAG: amidohydrolase [Ruminococcaceae bacterium]|nr:amidohydrolase [Oscillospiraceae bacterium]
MADINQRIIEMVDGMEKELVACRRDFHLHAESGWFEMRTSSLIARRLTELGYEVLVGEQVCKSDARMGLPSEEALEAHYQKALTQGADPEFVVPTRGGHTGVIGIMKCGEGPTVAMRFDIDALGVIEDAGDEHRPAHEGFGSMNPGMMHACGHDGHATIGLGVARVLASLKDELHGTFKLIFQPAEEGVRGAKSIVENGHLDGVQYFLGSHVGGLRPGDPGMIAPGSYGSLATTKYDVVFRGRSAHAGAAPHVGKNVMLAAATAVLNLYSIPRHGKGITRINVGTLNAGSGRNVIADEAKMEIEVRGENTEINQYVSDYAVSVLENAAKMHGCTCEIKLMGAADSLSSDRELAERVGKICQEKLNIPVCAQLMIRGGGSEDVSYMMNRVQEQGGQATFMRILSQQYAPAHNRRFDFDEVVLSNAVKIFCAAVYDILK